MSIKSKVIVIFLILLVIFMGHFLYANYCLDRLVDETKVLNAAGQMIEEVLQVRRYEKNFILRGNTEWAELWLLHLSNLSSRINNYRQIAQGPKDIEKIEELGAYLKNYHRAVDEYIKVYQDKESRPEPEIFVSTGRKILELCEQAKGSSESSIKRYLHNIIESRVFVLIIFIAVGVLTFRLTCQMIVNPIRKLQQLCRQLERNGAFNPKQIDSMDRLMQKINTKDEIGDLTRAYREMVLRCGNSYIGLQEKMKEIENLYKLKSEFTSVVSHELRTPLTAIKEGIDLVSDGSTGAINTEQKEFLDIAKRNVDRLAHLINEVLDFSKLTSKKIEFKMEMVNINDTIVSALNGFKAETERKGLSIIANLAPTEGVLIKTDADSINRVLLNLVNNAIRFTDKGGITVSASKEEKSNLVKVCVEDTGIGIKQEDIPKLFQPFVQVGDIKTRKTGGTGLGLAICKEIMERLGGKIWVEAEFGKGSRFCFIVPIAERRKA